MSAICRANVLLEKCVPRARPGVVKAAGHDDVEAVRLEVLVRELVLRDLAHGVRESGRRGFVSFSRDLIWINKAVFLARSGDVHADLRVVTADRFEDVELRFDVDAHRRRGLVERGLHE